MDTKDDKETLGKEEKKDAQCDSSQKAAVKQHGDKECSEKDKPTEEKSDKKKDGSCCSE